MTTGITKDAVVPLGRGSIRVAERAFQWRTERRNLISRDDHILDLARVLQGGGTLPPLLVYPIGDAYYVIDGHHRLAAYDTARCKGAILAHVFSGTLSEAERAALRSNNKNKLPMTQADKNTAAWRLVKREDPADTSGHSPQAHGRRALRSLTGSFKRHFIEPLHFPCRPIDTGDFRAARDTQARKTTECAPLRRWPYSIGSIPLATFTHRITITCACARAKTAD